MFWIDISEGHADIGRCMYKISGYSRPALVGALHLEFIAASRWNGRLRGYYSAVIRNYYSSADNVKPTLDNLLNCDSIYNITRSAMGEKRLED